MSDIFLELKDVSKLYQEVEALRDVNLSVGRGAICGLIGPNGSGKTTLMKVILGYVQYRGRVMFNGKDTREGVRLCYIPEVIRFYDYLTGEEAVRLITFLHGYDAEAMFDKFNVYARKLDYSDSQKLIKEHSKGNLRKLMLLQALSVDNDLMLLDEPFSGLDPMTVEKLIDCLLSLRQQRECTILINTHLFDAAKRLCDRLFFIDTGKIVADVPREEYGAIELTDIFEGKRK